MPYVLENRTSEGGYYTKIPNRKFKTIFELTYSISNAKVFNELEKSEAERIMKLLNMGGWDFILRKVNTECRKTSITRNHNKKKYRQCRKCKEDISQYGMCHKGYMNYYCKNGVKNGCKKVG